MELKLNTQEVEKVLLDFANTLLDAEFNKVKSDSYYGLGPVTFYCEKETTPEAAQDEAQ